MKNRILVLILVVSLMLLATGVTLAESSRTDAEISTDKSDYKPYEMVTISGVRFVSNAEVNIEVIRPDGALSCWIVNSDGEGDFATTYLLDGTAGMYTVKASDGMNGQESVFEITGAVTVPTGTGAATITTDKCEYDPEEVVTIKGCGFQPNGKVEVEIMRFDGTLSNWLVESDAEGFFFTTYGPDATAGMYMVKASDGFNGIETSFMIKSSERSTTIVTDLNKDKTVNILDITTVTTAYNTRPGDEKWNVMADLDKSEVISMPDVTIVAKDYGKTV